MTATTCCPHCAAILVGVALVCVAGGGRRSRQYATCPNPACAVALTRDTENRFHNESRRLAAARLRQDAPGALLILTRICAAAPATPWLAIHSPAIHASL
jgi:hypothetical protein